MGAQREDDDQNKSDWHFKKQVAKNHHTHIYLQGKGGGGGIKEFSLQHLLDVISYTLYRVYCIIREEKERKKIFIFRM